MNQDYEVILDELAVTHPLVAGALKQAHTNRVNDLSALTSGARLRGVEALLTWLSSMTDRFESSERLGPLTFLIKRVIADAQSALEATLAGYQGVAADAMRDVMEIELLLLDFATNPSHDQQWLTADAETRWQKFRPAKLRGRLKAAGVGRYAGEESDADYKAHSEAIHVSPRSLPFGAKGLTTDQWTRDAGFWELLEHGRRMIFAVHRLESSVAGADLQDPDTDPDLDAVRDAWERTQEMQSMYLALLQATFDGQKEPSDSEE